MKNFNENRAGYKKTSLGWIPEDWEVAEIKKFGVVSTGNTPSTKDLSNFGNAFCFVTPVDLLGQKYITSSARMLSQYGFNSSRKVSKGSILFVCIGSTIGKVGIAGKDLACNQQINFVLINEDNDNEFLFYELQLLVPKIRELAGTQAVPIINKSVFENIVVKKPPYEVQKKISKILSAWDYTIEATEKLIAAKEKLKKGLMQQLLTGKKRLKGFKGEWKKVKLRDLVKETKRPVDWDEEKLYNLLSIRRRSGGVFYRESLYGNQILTKGLFITKEKDFLISKMQIVHGASGLVNKNLDGMYISGSYIALRSKDDSKLDIHFFDWISKTRFFYNLCYTSSYGVHIEKMTFDFQDFLKRSISVPTDINEQKRIAEILDKVNEEIKLLKEKMILSKLQKKGLMQVLLTGKVRVKI
ncbi:MAG: restriction endonuclease subunit S [Ignavibacteria bacterium]|nr:restriction endonuclease subunit S [Ignavibacteria bacterium]